MCTGVEYVSHEDYYNPKRTAAPVRTSGDGDGGGTVGRAYRDTPMNVMGSGKKSKSTMTTASTPSTSRTTGLGFGGKGPDKDKYTGGLY